MSTDNPKQNKKEVVVTVSGGFDPVHIGHIRLFQEAHQLGDKLVVILNNDNWLRAKKWHIFMPENERKEVLESLNSVDEVILSHHPEHFTDRSVCRELEDVRPNIFANGGDRKLDNIPEVATCEAINCQMVFNVGHGDKVQSSSWLLDRYIRNIELGKEAIKFANKKIVILNLSDNTNPAEDFIFDIKIPPLIARLLEKKTVVILTPPDKQKNYQSKITGSLQKITKQLKNLIFLPFFSRPDKIGEPKLISSEFSFLSSLPVKDAVYIGNNSIPLINQSLINIQDKEDLMTTLNFLHQP